jgi:hypothetical protein
MRTIDATNPALRIIRAVLAALVFVAVARQLIVVFEQPDPAPVHFFSFFTIQANLIAGAVWLFGAWRPASLAARPLLRGAATTYLAITGIVYFALSFDPNKDELLELTAWWVNALTHQVLPLAAIIEWILVPPTRRITARVSLTWLLYPVAYFVYSMVVGFFTGWYPYPFLVPGYWQGYSGVVFNALVILAMMIPIAVAVGWIGSRRQALGPVDS